MGTNPRLGNPNPNTGIIMKTYILLKFEKLSVCVDDSQGRTLLARR